jgi:hypothetical protein
MKTSFLLGTLLTFLSTGVLAECPKDPGYIGATELLPACTEQQEPSAIREEPRQQATDTAAKNPERGYDCAESSEQT